MPCRPQPALTNQTPCRRSSAAKSIAADSDLLALQAVVSCQPPFVFSAARGQLPSLWLLSQNAFPWNIVSNLAAWQPLSLTYVSCRPQSAQEVCIHHVFVMLKVLRLAPSNPIIWQLSLLGEPCLCVASAGGFFLQGGSTHSCRVVLVQQPLP